MHRPPHAPLLSFALVLGVLLGSLAAAQTPPAPPPPQPAAAPGGSPGSATAPPTRPPLHLTLEQATSLALRQQPTIRSALQAQAAAQARIPQATSAYYPRLDWLSSASRSQVFSSTLNRPVTGDSLTTQLQANQLLYDFGKTASLVDQAKAGARDAAGETERVRQVVVQNVRQAYFGLLQAQRLVGVADASLARAELNLRSAQGFFDVGTKPKSDVTRAEVDVANARVDVIRARNSVRLAQTTLANAVGLEATVPLEIEDILTYEPVALDSAQLLAEALANRPELQQARARLDSARAQLAGARAGYWPDLVATGSYGGIGDDPELHEVWTVGASLSWNLFHGFFTQNRVKETEALVETARANADVLELQVRLEVEQAYLNVTEAAERIVATAKAIESARENLRLAQGRYDAGVGTILDLTDAQLALTNAEADQVRALTDYRVGLATLDRAVGRR
jgi:outer membrane protein